MFCASRISNTGSKAVQNISVDEVNSPILQRYISPGYDRLKVVNVSLRKYWGPPFGLIYTQ